MAAFELDYIIPTLYSQPDLHYIRWMTYKESQIPNTGKYLEIPITMNDFEVPILALDSFIHLINKKGIFYGKLVAGLQADRVREPRYKTLDRCMRDQLMLNFKRAMVERCVAKMGNDTVNYYVIQGAVFNEDFKPVMMCTWQVQLVMRQNVDGGLGPRYNFIKPILRISPEIYANQEDEMEKFLSKKMVSKYLRTPAFDYMLNMNYSWYKAPDTIDRAVIIEDIPFDVISVPNPSINTTGEDLRNIAINHIDEVMQ